MRSNAVGSQLLSGSGHLFAGISIGRLGGGHLLQHVTLPVDRSNNGTAGLNVLAQTMNVNFNRVLADLFVVAVQMFNQLVLAHNAACGAQQYFEHANFGLG